MLSSSKHELVEARTADVVLPYCSVLRVLTATRKARSSEEMLHRTPRRVRPRLKYENRCVRYNNIDI